LLLAKYVYFASTEILMMIDIFVVLLISAHIWLPFWIASYITLLFVVLISRE